MALARRAKVELSRGKCPVDEADYELVDSIEIDFSLIPDYVREDLAAATYELVQEILSQPGGREMLNARTAARKLRKNIK